MWSFAITGSGNDIDLLSCLSVAPGFNDSGHYAAYLLQGGLEMPDREYYLSDTTEIPVQTVDRANTVDL